MDGRQVVVYLPTVRRILGDVPGQRAYVVVGGIQSRCPMQEEEGEDMTTNDLIPNVEIPEGVSGDWVVERFEVSQQDADLFNLRARIHRDYRTIKPGTYTRLKHHGDVIMSDTPSEKIDHVAFVRWAAGGVLVNGLGLGMVIEACLRKPSVESVTVVEISPDVIKLVGPTLTAKWGDRLAIVQGDALTVKWPKGTRWHSVWHDIWPTISASNWPDMKTLHRRYGGRCANQDSWCRDIVLDMVKGRW